MIITEYYFINTVNNNSLVGKMHNAKKTRLNRTEFK